MIRIIEYPVKLNEIMSFDRLKFTKLNQLKFFEMPIQRIVKKRRNITFS